MMMISLLFAMLITSAYAHDHERPDLDAWFNGLTNQIGGSCCNGSEARPAEAVWDMEAGKYRVKRNRRWVDVPPNAIIKGPNRAGYAMVWWGHDSVGQEVVRCFAPGAGG